VATGSTIPFVKRDAEISGVSLFECLLLNGQSHRCVDELIFMLFFCRQLKLGPASKSSLIMLAQSHVL
jgi:hypothetical protein